MMRSTVSRVLAKRARRIVVAASATDDVNVVTANGEGGGPAARPPIQKLFHCCADVSLAQICFKREFLPLERRLRLHVCTVMAKHDRGARNFPRHGTELRFYGRFFAREEL